MAKRYNNQILLIILALLTLVLVWAKFIRSPRKERTFRQELVRIDTSQVSKIILHPQAEKGTAIVLIKQENQWILQGQDRSHAAQKSSVQNLLAELMRMKAQRLVANSKDQWAEYQLTDSLATRVEVYESDQLVADVLIGRFTYKQAPQNQYGYGQNIQGSSYVRLSDEKEVYAVEGFLTVTFNQGFDHWRDHTFLKTRKDDLSKITFEYPADSSFVLEKTGTQWYAGQQLADSSNVDAFLGQLQSRDLYDFVDHFQGIPDYTVTIEGNNMMPITVKAFKQSDEEYYLHSSLNPDAFFYSAVSGIFKDVFIPITKVLPANSP